jgi:hypothetical protein
VSTQPEPRVGSHLSLHTAETRLQWPGRWGEDRDRQATLEGPCHQDRIGKDKKPKMAVVSLEEEGEQS